MNKVEYRLRLDLDNEAQRYVAEEINKRLNGINSSCPQVIIHSLYEYFRFEEEGGLKGFLGQLLREQTKQILTGVGQVPGEPATSQRMPDMEYVTNKPLGTSKQEEEKEPEGQAAKLPPGVLDFMQKFN